jgi:hypothetical protein
MSHKPTIKEQPDGNVFAIMAVVARALARAGLPLQRDAFNKEVSEYCKSADASYHGVLAITHKYVDWDTSAWDEDESDDEDEEEDSE